MDKVDAYDKEQLQAMGWLFDEIETPDGGVVLKGVFIANVPIAKGDLVICQADTLDAIKVVSGARYTYYRSAFAVAQSDAEAGQAVDVRLNGGTLDVTGMPGTGNVLYVRATTPADPTQEMLSLTVSSVSFDAPTFSKDIAIALGVRMDATTVSLFSEPQYFYLAYNEAANKQEMVSFANPINVEAVGRLLGQSTAFGQKLAAYSPFWEALTSNELFVRSLGGKSAFGESLAANATFANALAAFTTFQNSLAGKSNFGTQLGVNAGLAPVRTVKQTLTNEQKQTAWGNIGLNVYIIDQSKFGTALTDAELAAYNAAEAILVTNHQKYVSALYLLASNSGGNAMFYSVVNSSTFMRIRIVDPNTIVNETSVLSDQNAIVFSTNQSLSIAQSNRAIGNVGTGFYIVPYGGTVPAADLERAVGASALILMNTPSESMPKIYLRGRVNAEGNIYFYSLTDSYTAMSVILNPTTGAVSPVTTNNITAGLLSYGSVQNLSIDDTNRVMSNIGLGYVVIPIAGTRTTLTQAQETAMLNAKGVIFLGSLPYEPATRRVYVAGQTDGNIVLLYALLSGSKYLMASYLKDTKQLTLDGVAYDLAPEAVRFSVQNLTKAQQTQVLDNLGLDFVSLPSTVFNTPLTDTQDAQVKAARAVIIDGQRFVYHYTSAYERYTYFYAFNDVSSVYVLRYDASTKTFIAPGRSPITDLGALRFDKAQSLTPAQQAQARANIGIPEGLLNDADFIAGLKTKLGL